MKNSKNESKNEDKKMISASSETTAQGEEIVGLSPAIQEDIGRRLRGLYGQLTAEPLPDRFVNLLNELSASEKPGRLA